MSGTRILLRDLNGIGGGGSPPSEGGTPPWARMGGGQVRPQHRTRPEAEAIAARLIARREVPTPVASPVVDEVTSSPQADLERFLHEDRREIPLPSTLSEPQTYQSSETWTGLNEITEQVLNGEDPLQQITADLVRPTEVVDDDTSQQINDTMAGWVGMDPSPVRHRFVPPRSEIRAIPTHLNAMSHIDGELAEIQAWAENPENVGAALPADFRQRLGECLWALRHFTLIPEDRRRTYRHRILQLSQRLYRRDPQWLADVRRVTHRQIGELEASARREVAGGMVNSRTRMETLWRAYQLRLWQIAVLNRTGSSPEPTEAEANHLQDLLDELSSLAIRSLPAYQNSHEAGQPLPENLTDGGRDRLGPYALLLQVSRAEREMLGQACYRFFSVADRMRHVAQTLARQARDLESSDPFLALELYREAELCRMRLPNLSAMVDQGPIIMRLVGRVEAATNAASTLTPPQRADRYVTLASAALAAGEEEQARDVAAGESVVSEERTRALALLDRAEAALAELPAGADRIRERGELIASYLQLGLREEALTLIRRWQQEATEGRPSLQLTGEFINLIEVFVAQEDPACARQVMTLARELADRLNPSDRLRALQELLTPLSSIQQFEIIHPGNEQLPAMEVRLRTERSEILRAMAQLLTDSAEGISVAVQIEAWMILVRNSSSYQEATRYWDQATRAIDLQDLDSAQRVDWFQDRGQALIQIRDRFAHDADTRHLMGIRFFNFARDWQVEGINFGIEGLTPEQLDVLAAGQALPQDTQLPPRGFQILSARSYLAFCRLAGSGIYIPDDAPLGNGVRVSLTEGHHNLGLRPPLRILEEVLESIEQSDEQVRLRDLENGLEQADSRQQVRLRLQREALTQTVQFLMGQNCIHEASQVLLHLERTVTAALPLDERIQNRFLIQEAYSEIQRRAEQQLARDPGNSILQGLVESSRASVSRLGEVIRIDSEDATAEESPTVLLARARGQIARGNIEGARETLATLAGREVPEGDTVMAQAVETARDVIVDVEQDRISRISRFLTVIIDEILPANMPGMHHIQRDHALTVLSELPDFLRTLDVDENFPQGFQRALERYAAQSETHRARVESLRAFMEQIDPAQPAEGSSLPLRGLEAIGLAEEMRIEDQPSLIECLDELGTNEQVRRAFVALQRVVERLTSWQDGEENVQASVVYLADMLQMRVQEDEGLRREITQFRDFIPYEVMGGAILREIISLQMLLDVVGMALVGYMAGRIAMRAMTMASRFSTLAVRGSRTAQEALEMVQRGGSIRYAVRAAQGMERVGTRAGWFARTARTVGLMGRVGMAHGLPRAAHLLTNATVFHFGMQLWHGAVADPIAGLINRSGWRSDSALRQSEYQAHLAHLNPRSVWEGYIPTLFDFWFMGRMMPMLGIAEMHWFPRSIYSGFLGTGSGLIRMGMDRAISYGFDSAREAFRLAGWRFWEERPLWLRFMQEGENPLDARQFIRNMAMGVFVDFAGAHHEARQVNAQHHQLMETHARMTRMAEEVYGFREGEIFANASRWGEAERARQEEARRFLNDLYELAERTEGNLGNFSDSHLASAYHLAARSEGIFPEGQTRAERTQMLLHAAQQVTHARGEAQARVRDLREVVDRVRLGEWEFHSSEEGTLRFTSSGRVIEEAEALHARLSGQRESLEHVSRDQNRPLLAQRAGQALRALQELENQLRIVREQRDVTTFDPLVRDIMIANLTSRVRGVERALRQTQRDARREQRVLQWARGLARRLGFAFFGDTSEFIQASLLLAGESGSSLFGQEGRLRQIQNQFAEAEAEIERRLARLGQAENPPEQVLGLRRQIFLSLLSGRADQVSGLIAEVLPLPVRRTTSRTRSQAPRRARRQAGGNAVHGAPRRRGAERPSRRSHGDRGNEGPRTPRRGDSTRQIISVPPTSEAATIASDPVAEAQPNPEPSHRARAAATAEHQTHAEAQQAAHGEETATVTFGFQSGKDQGGQQRQHDGSSENSARQAEDAESDAFWEAISAINPFMESIEPAVASISDRRFRDKVRTAIWYTRHEAELIGLDYTLTQAYRDIAALKNGRAILSENNMDIIHLQPLPESLARVPPANDNSYPADAPRHGEAASPTHTVQAAPQATMMAGGMMMFTSGAATGSTFSMIFGFGFATYGALWLANPRLNILHRYLRLIFNRTVAAARSRIEGWRGRSTSTVSAEASRTSASGPIRAETPDAGDSTPPSSPHQRLSTAAREALAQINRIREAYEGREDTEALRDRDEAIRQVLENYREVREEIEAELASERFQVPIQLDAEATLAEIQYLAQGTVRSPFQRAARSALARLQGLSPDSPQYRQVLEAYRRTHDRVARYFATSHRRALSHFVGFMESQEMQRRFPGVQVEHRPKDPTQMGQKILRRGWNNLSEFFDITGARVVVANRQEAEAVRRYIEEWARREGEDFLLLDGEAEDIANKRGYAAIHLNVRMRMASEGRRGYQPALEIQIQTESTSRWEAIQRDLVYKNRQNASIPQNVKDALEAYCREAADYLYWLENLDNLAARRQGGSTMDRIAPPPRPSLQGITWQAIADPAVRRMVGRGVFRMERLLNEFEGRYISQSREPVVAEAQEQTGVFARPEPVTAEIQTRQMPIASPADNVIPFPTLPTLQPPPYSIGLELPAASHHQGDFNAVLRLLGNHDLQRQLRRDLRSQDPVRRNQAQEVYDRLSTLLHNVEEITRSSRWLEDHNGSSDIVGDLLREYLMEVREKDASLADELQDLIELGSMDGFREIEIAFAPQSHGLGEVFSKIWTAAETLSRIPQEQHWVEDNLTDLRNRLEVLLPLLAEMGHTVDRDALSRPFEEAERRAARPSHPSEIERGGDSSRKITQRPSRFGRRMAVPVGDLRPPPVPREAALLGEDRTDVQEQPQVEDGVVPGNGSESSSQGFTHQDQSQPCDTDVGVLSPEERVEEISGDQAPEMAAEETPRLAGEDAPTDVLPAAMRNGIIIGGATLLAAGLAEFLLPGSAEAAVRTVHQVADQANGVVDILVEAAKWLIVPLVAATVVRFTRTTVRLPRSNISTTESTAQSHAATVSEICHQFREAGLEDATLPASDTRPQETLSERLAYWMAEGRIRQEDIAFAISSGLELSSLLDAVMGPPSARLRQLAENPIAFLARFSVVSRTTSTVRRLVRLTVSGSDRIRTLQALTAGLEQTVDSTAELRWLNDLQDRMGVEDLFNTSPAARQLRETLQAAGIEISRTSEGRISVTLRISTDTRRALNSIFDITRTARDAGIIDQPGGLSQDQLVTLLTTLYLHQSPSVRIGSAELTHVPMVVQGTLDFLLAQDPQASVSERRLALVAALLHDAGKWDPNLRTESGYTLRPHPFFNPTEREIVVLPGESLPEALRRLQSEETPSELRLTAEQAAQVRIPGFLVSVIAHHDSSSVRQTLHTLEAQGILRPGEAQRVWQAIERHGLVSSWILDNSFGGIGVLSHVFQHPAFSEYVRLYRSATDRMLRGEVVDLSVQSTDPEVIRIRQIFQETFTPLDRAMMLGDHQGQIDIAKYLDILSAVYRNPFRARGVTSGDVLMTPETATVEDVFFATSANAPVRMTHTVEGVIETHTQEQRLLDPVLGEQAAQAFEVAQQWLQSEPGLVEAIDPTGTREAPADQQPTAQRAYRQWLQSHPELDPNAPATLRAWLREVPLFERDGNGAIVRNAQGQAQFNPTFLAIRHQVEQSFYHFYALSADSPLAWHQTETESELRVAARPSHPAEATRGMDAETEADSTFARLVEGGTKIGAAGLAFFVGDSLLNPSSGAAQDLPSILQNHPIIEHLSLELAFILSGTVSLGLVAGMLYLGMSLIERFEARQSRRIRRESVRNRMEAAIARAKSETANIQGGPFRDAADVATDPFLRAVASELAIIHERFAEPHQPLWLRLESLEEYSWCLEYLREGTDASLAEEAEALLILARDIHSNPGNYGELTSENVNDVLGPLFNQLAALTPHIPSGHEVISRMTEALELLGELAAGPHTATFSYETRNVLLDWVARAVMRLSPGPLVDSLVLRLLGTIKNYQEHGLSQKIREAIEELQRRVQARSHGEPAYRISEEALRAADEASAAEAGPKVRVEEMEESSTARAGRGNGFGGVITAAGAIIAGGGLLSGCSDPIQIATQQGPELVANLGLAAGIAATTALVIVASGVAAYAGYNHIRGQRSEPRDTTLPRMPSTKLWNVPATGTSMMIGRDPASTFVAPYDVVSNQHAAVQYDAATGRWRAQGLGRNGTLVIRRGGIAARLFHNSPPFEVQHGDILRIADVEDIVLMLPNRIALRREGDVFFLGRLDFEGNNPDLSRDHVQFSMQPDGSYIIQNTSNGKFGPNYVWIQGSDQRWIRLNPYDVDFIRPGQAIKLGPEEPFAVEMQFQGDSVLYRPRSESPRPQRPARPPKVPVASVEPVRPMAPLRAAARAGNPGPMPTIRPAAPKPIVGEVWQHQEIIADPYSDGYMLTAKPIAPFRGTSEIQSGFEGNLREVFERFPRLRQVLGGIVHPDGAVTYPDARAANRRLEQAGFGFRFFETEGEASVIDTIHHLAQDLPHFPYSRTGSQHFHDFGVHLLGIAALPPAHLQRIREMARFWIQLRRDPQLQEPAIQTWIEDEMKRFVEDAMDGVTAYLHDNLISGDRVGVENQLSSNIWKWTNRAYALQCLLNHFRMNPTYQNSPLPQGLGRVRELHHHFSGLPQESLSLPNEAEVANYLRQIEAQIGPFVPPT